MQLPAAATPEAATPAAAGVLRRFRRDRRGSAAVEFAFIAPVFFALLFAIIETGFVFFAGQVLETGVQDTGRVLYTSQSTTALDFKAALCTRVSVMFSNCTDICVDVRSYDPGVAFTITDPISAGAYVDDCRFNPPLKGNETVVVRAFYQWPLFVTGLGYNIANIGRGTTNKRLLAATAAFRPQ